MKKTDKHGNILAVGDTLRNRKGEEAKIENISGVAMLVHRDENREIKQTIILSKVDLTQMEKVNIKRNENV